MRLYGGKTIGVGGRLRLVVMVVTTLATVGLALDSVAQDYHQEDPIPASPRQDLTPIESLFRPPPPAPLSLFPQMRNQMQDAPAFIADSTVSINPRYFYFDRVISSRTMHELDDPTEVITEALRVGRTLTVGFVNHGYWKNRVDVLLRGRKVRNDVYTTEWFESRPANPLTIADFEHFCAVKNIRVARRAHLAGNWHTPCHSLPNIFAGYALYDLMK